MKAIYLFLFSLFTICVYSQTEKPINKGNYQIGGDIELSFAKMNDVLNGSKSNTKNIYIALHPMIGYFVINGLVIGAEPNIKISSTNMDDEVTNNYEVGIGPYTKYYFNNGILFKFSSHYNYIFTKGPESIYKINDHTFQVTSGIGYGYFINNKVSLEVLLNYTYTRRIYISDDDLVNYKLNRNKTHFGLGLQIFL